MGSVPTNLHNTTITLYGEYPPTYTALQVPYVVSTYQATSKQTSAEFAWKLVMLNRENENIGYREAKHRI